MSLQPSYDAISREYQESKQLPFRIHVELHTLLRLLGDVEGLSVLDLACGEGIYSRQLRRAGATRVVGVDLSPEMIALAQKEEEQEPLGCEFLIGDASELGKVGSFDLVIGSYLLNYASSPEMIQRFAETIRINLKRGGRFVGINDNPGQDPSRYALCEPYGFTKSTPANRSEGDPITYTFRKIDGGTFAFDNFYLHPVTIRNAFLEKDFSRFEWEGPWLAPGSEAGFPPDYWNDFLLDPPIIGVQAWRD